VSGNSFSMKELQDAPRVDLAGSVSIRAGDGVGLSFRRYVPAKPRAVLLFYHGGGAHSGAGYQFIGSGLQKQFDIAVYTPDIRGHGASEGRRGDSPHRKQVWADIDTFIKLARTEHPNLPLFLGGHSSGAGLILNYASQPRHEPLEGYVFLAPDFGFRSKTSRPDKIEPFATAHVPAFVANALSGGLVFGHAYAVRFNYPSELLAADPRIVIAYTVNMANAVTPSNPHQQFSSLDRPFGMWIGTEDEMNLSSRVLAFADLAASVRAESEATSLLGEKHLSILIKAHEVIGPWLLRHYNLKDRVNPED